MCTNILTLWKNHSQPFATWELNPSKMRKGGSGGVLSIERRTVTRLVSLGRAGT
jgi:hypothetical protein